MSGDPDARVKDVRVATDALSVDLEDGRTITVPLDWYPRLLHATARQRNNGQACGGGYGIPWPDVHEHLSTEKTLPQIAPNRGQVAFLGGESRPDPAAGSGRIGA